MAEPISTTILTSLVYGLIFGVLDSIHKNIMHILFLLSVVGIVIAYFVQGPTQMAETLNWGVWNWITMMIVITVVASGTKSAINQIKEEFF